MIKRRIVTLAAILSITLTGCAGLESQSTIKALEPEKVAETETAVDINVLGEPENEENYSPLNQDEIVPTVEKIEPVQESENVPSELNESRGEVPKASEEAPTVEAFISLENTSTFEYDAANDQYIINGTSYDIASDEFDFHGGYMFYCMGKGVIEQIAYYINGDYQEKYWRDGYTPELLEEAENSTLLERFMDSGGKIENYYILTHPNFYVAEMTVVVEYSLGGEIYHAILGISMSVETTEEEVIYRVTDVFQLENLDEWEKWFEELNSL